MCYSFVPQLLQENHFQIGNLTFWRSREVPPGSYLLLLTVLPNIFISFPLIVSYGWRSLKCSCEQCYLSTCLDCHYITNHHINAMTIMSMSKKHKKGTRCLKKSWVLPNWAFGDPASSWEEILMICVTNLEMLNSVKLSLLRHPVNTSAGIRLPFLELGADRGRHGEVEPSKIWSLKRFNYCIDAVK